MHAQLRGAHMQGPQVQPQQVAHGSGLCWRQPAGAAGQGKCGGALDQCLVSDTLKNEAVLHSRAAQCNSHPGTHLVAVSKSWRALACAQGRPVRQRTSTIRLACASLGTVLHGRLAEHGQVDSDACRTTAGAMRTVSSYSVCKQGAMQALVHRQCLGAARSHPLCTRAS